MAEQEEQLELEEQAETVEEPTKVEKKKPLSMKSLEERLDAMEAKALMTEEQIQEEVERRLTEKIEAMADRDYTARGGKVAGTKILVQTPDEYRKSSAERGLVMGRRPDEKTNCTVEELRALINSNWTPSMIMEKHGISVEEFKQLVWKLSRKELRDRPIRFSIERDTISKEG